MKQAKPRKLQSLSTRRGRAEPGNIEDANEPPGHLRDETAQRPLTRVRTMGPQSAGTNRITRSHKLTNTLNMRKMTCRRLQFTAPLARHTAPPTQHAKAIRNIKPGSRPNRHLKPHVCCACRCVVRAGVQEERVRGRGSECRRWGSPPCQRAWH